MGVKIKVSLEQGDAKATLKIKQTSGKDDPVEQSVEIGGASTEHTTELELEKGNKLEVDIEKVMRIVYDPQQMMNVEKEDTEREDEEEGGEQEEEGEASAKPVTKSPGASSSGAKEAASAASRKPPIDSDQVKGEEGPKRKY